MIVSRNSLFFRERHFVEYLAFIKPEVSRHCTLNKIRIVLLKFVRTEECPVGCFLYLNKSHGLFTTV
jgi:hypothetical protein